MPLLLKVSAYHQIEEQILLLMELRERKYIF
jgi:hypothetical protein